jgi:hypothetical protein
MFPMTVTINTMTEFEALMNALGVGKAKTNKEKETPPAAKAADQAPVSANNSASSMPKTSLPPAEAVTAAPVAAGVTYADVAAAITNLSKTKGREAAVAVLARFGATKLPDVKPEDFAALIEAAKA